MVNLLRRKGAPVATVFGCLDSVDQRLELDADVLVHVRNYRQISWLATEAGGQLFGTITPELIRVEKATGPYPGDERSRRRYRSNPAAAQAAIQAQALAGLLYLGEWHTHAEDHPDVSGLDEEAMSLLLARSQLNSNALLMLIVGRGVTVDGVALWTVAPDRIHQWTLR